MSVVRTTSRRLDVQLAVAVTLIVQMGISLLSAATPILAPTIAADRGWNVTLVALYPTAVYATAFLVSFQVPAILSRIGGMGLILVCLAVSALGILGLLSSSLMLIAAVPLSLGFALGAMNPASSQILGPRMSPFNAGLIMSIKSTGIPAGIMLAGVIFPVLVSWFGWQGAVLRAAAVAIVISIALLPSVRRFNEDVVSGTTAKKQRVIDPIYRLVAIPGMTRFLVAAGIFGAMQFCLRTFFVVHLVDHAGLSLATAGLALSASQAAGVLGQLMWATTSDRMLSTPATMAIIGMLMTLGAVLTASVGSDSSLTWIVAIAAVYGISAGGFFPLVLAEVARRSSQGDAGPLTAAAQVILIPINLCGPLLFGAVAAIASFPFAFLALAACTLGASIMVGTERAVRRDIEPAN